MNPQTNKLFAQALDQAVPETWTTLTPEQVTKFAEKFSELIVKECMNIADGQKKQVEEMEVYNLQDEVWNRARIQQSQQIVDKIKQHFGVDQ